MPIYEYRCETCAHLVEVLQKHTDPPPVCQPCDERMPAETPHMERQVSRCSFKLSGDGWARDSYGLSTGQDG